MIFLRPSIQRAKVYRGKKSSAGSITVFASLSLLLVASFLLVLLEAARLKGLEAYQTMHSVNAMESVFSEYDRRLFETYGVFLLDGGYGSGELQISQINGRLQAAAQKNVRPVIPAQAWRNVQDFYQMDVTAASVTGFLLATDHEGAPFRAMAAASIKAQYPSALLQKLHDGFLTSDQAMAGAERSRAAMDSAQENIQSAKEKQAQEAASAEAGGSQEQEAASVSVEDPMEVVKAVRKKDILTLVMPAGSAVSSKEIRQKQTLEERSLLQGNEAWDKTDGWSEAVLYQLFLQEQFTCYEPGASGDRALDYELEYIHAGKKSDRENLKRVVQQLLLMREGANYMYLQTDSVKQQEAYGIATAIAASVGIAPAAGLIAQGILAAWAYAESILDVRTLLAGGRISWMKTAQSWTSSLSGMGELLSGNMRAKEQEGGEAYRDYLQKLLWLHSRRSLAYRAMDLMELYGEQNGQKIRMDAMILSLRAELVYEADALFSKMVTTNMLPADRWEWKESVSYSYFRGD